MNDELKTLPVGNHDKNIQHLSSQIDQICRLAIRLKGKLDFHERGTGEAIEALNAIRSMFSATRELNQLLIEISGPLIEEDEIKVESKVMVH